MKTGLLITSMILSLWVFASQAGSAAGSLPTVEEDFFPVEGDAAYFQRCMIDLLDEDNSPDHYFFLAAGQYCSAKALGNISFRPKFKWIDAYVENGFLHTKAEIDNSDQDNIDNYNIINAVIFELRLYDKKDNKIREFLTLHGVSDPFYLLPGDRKIVTGKIRITNDAAYKAVTSGASVIWPSRYHGLKLPRLQALEIDRARNKKPVGPPQRVDVLNKKFPFTIEENPESEKPPQ